MANVTTIRTEGDEVVIGHEIQEYNAEAGAMDIVGTGELRIPAANWDDFKKAISGVYAPPLDQCEFRIDQQGTEQVVA